MDRVDATWGEGHDDRIRTTHIPDDGERVDALSEIAPTPKQLEKLLVVNPQRLYRFAV